MKISYDDFCAWCAVAFTGFLSASVTLLIYTMLVNPPHRHVKEPQAVPDTTPVRATVCNRILT